MYYSVKVLFKSIVPEDQADVPSFEEILYLVEAESDEEARKNVRPHAAEYNRSYTNANGQTCVCTIVDVLDAFRLFDAIPRSGTELYARGFSTADEYLRQVKSYLVTTRGTMKTDRRD